MKQLNLLLALAGAVAFVVAISMTNLSRADDAPAAGAEPPPTKELFEAGKRTFGNRCARCHGWNMVNLGSIAFDLRKFPHNDRARFMNSVHNGKNAMPAWKGILTENEIEGVWAYVRMGGQM